MAHELHEDGFHEIQLSGKQLVFLFMATTVVSIVIFLCGVLVGRGVQNARGLMELILLNIGLNAGIVSPEIYTILAVMAIVTTFAATPMYRWIANGHIFDAHGVHAPPAATKAPEPVASPA